MLSFADGFEGTITYASSNTDVATISENGVVTLGETAGSTTITASFVASENDDWISSSASYTLRVMSPDAPVGISFGMNNVKINGPLVTGEDSYGNIWTITTECGQYTYFGQQDGYSTIGSNKDHATSITFTTTLPDTYTVLEFSATFGGAKGVDGAVTLKVGDTTVGEGNVTGGKNGTAISSTSKAIGQTLTVTVTGINNVLNCYNISYKVIAPAEITMNQYGLMSYAFDKPLDFSYAEGLTAYVATGIDERDLTMTPVEKTAVGEGLMLEGAQGTYKVPVATTEPAAVSGNMLVGLTEATEVQQEKDGYTTFILANGADGVNWYMLEETSYTLKANSAYLKLATDQIPASRSLTMVFGDPSGIENVNRQAVNNNQYFDLSGRRVAQPTKGLYIVNGKKVYIK